MDVQTTITVLLLYLRKQLQGAYSFYDFQADLWRFIRDGHHLNPKIYLL